MIDMSYRNCCLWLAARKGMWMLLSITSFVKPGREWTEISHAWGKIPMSDIQKDIPRPRIKTISRWKRYEGFAGKSCFFGVKCRQENTFWSWLNYVCATGSCLRFEDQTVVRQYTTVYMTCPNKNVDTKANTVEKGMG